MMEKREIINLVVGFAGLCIMIWLLYGAIKEMVLQPPTRLSLVRNFIIITFTFVYMVGFVWLGVFPLFD